MHPHRIDDLSRRRHHPDDHQGASIDNGLAIHENSILAVVSPYCIDLDLELTAKARRHTDGMQARDSERAVANGYPSHGDLRAGLS